MERPILFSGPMVLAILAGRKTQTRRIVSKSNSCTSPPWDRLEFDDKKIPSRVCTFADNGYLHVATKPEPPEAGDEWWTMNRVYPHIEAGDRLWVRETFAIELQSDIVVEGCAVASGGDPEVYYRADGEDQWKCGWRPSIHMPRWASRINLEVTGVRVERVQDISEADAKAEGMFQFADTGIWGSGNPTAGPMCGDSAKDAFRLLWEKINGDGSWGVNPWTWVIEFKRIEGK